MAQYKTLNNFANEFSSSTNYAVGDLVMYLGELYVCSTTHNAGVWNSSHFTKTSVATQLANAGGGADTYTSNNVIYYHSYDFTSSLTQDNIKVYSSLGIAGTMYNNDKEVIIYTPSYEYNETYQTWTQQDDVNLYFNPSNAIITGLNKEKLKSISFNYTGNFYYYFEYLSDYITNEGDMIVGGLNGNLTTLSGNSTNTTQFLTCTRNFIGWNSLNSFTNTIYKHRIEYTTSKYLYLYSTIDNEITDISSASSVISNTICAKLVNETSQIDLIVPIIYSGMASQTELLIVYYDITNQTINSETISFTDIFGNDSVVEA